MSAGFWRSARACAAPATCVVGIEGVSGVGGRANARGRLVLPARRVATNVTLRNYECTSDLAWEGLTDSDRNRSARDPPIAQADAQNVTEERANA